MAIENRDVPFSVDGQSFVGIRRLGFTDRGSFVIDAWTTPAPAPRGSYFTSIPISPREYREVHPTRAAFRVTAPNMLIVYSDYGEPTTIKAPPDVVSALEAECAAVLPRAPFPAPKEPSAP
jgi:hypothetical protein